MSRHALLAPASRYNVEKKMEIRTQIKYWVKPTEWPLGVPTMVSTSLTHLMSTPSCYGVRQNSSANTSCSSSYREVVIKRRFRGLAYPISFTCTPHRILSLGGLGHKKLLRTPTKLQRLQRIFDVSKEGMVIRAGFKNKVKKAVRNLERSLQDGKLEELQDELPQLAIALPLGLVSFEALFMVGWVSSLRGLLPGTRGFFSAGDLILCSIMLANFIVGWYALEHSRSELNSLPREKWWSKLKVSQPGLIDYGFSLARGLIPFANLFVWLRLARRQQHLSARAKAGMVANAWVYGGPPLFTLLLLLNGGWSVFFQIGLVSNVALILGALHLPFEEARVKNEKVLMEVAKTERLSGKLKEKDPKPVPKEISLEEKEKIQRLKELEEFDMLLAQTSPRENSVLSGRPEKWSVGDTMQWLAEQGLARYASMFAENNIDGPLLLQLSNDDLRDEVGIQSLGDRRKLVMLIEQLQRNGYT